MGCIARAGCVALLVILGIVAYLNRDRLLNRPAPKSASATSEWAPLTEQGASRTDEGLKKLSTRTGPVFVTLAGSDVASYIFLQIAKSMPASTDSFAARVHDDQVSLRASMNTKELGSVVGSLGSLLGDRERVEMSGSLRVVSKGLAEFKVTSVKVHGLTLPAAVISRLVNPLVKGKRPAGLDEGALPISIPPYIGDVRVANGKITLYKNVQ